MKDGVNNVIVITLLIDQTWANIRVAYIAHSRKDLFVGSVLLGTNCLMKILQVHTIAQVQLNKSFEATQ